MPDTCVYIFPQTQEVAAYLNNDMMEGLIRQKTSLAPVFSLVHGRDSIRKENTIRREKLCGRRTPSAECEVRHSGVLGPVD